MSEDVQSDLMEAGRYHAEAIVFKCFKSGLQKAAETEHGDGVDPKVLPHLERLLVIYGLKALSN